MAKSKARMDNNCHIPYLKQAFFNVENGGVNLVLQLAKAITCMTVAYNSITLTTMCEQNTNVKNRDTAVIIMLLS